MSQSKFYAYYKYTHNIASTLIMFVFFNSMISNTKVICCPNYYNDECSALKKSYVYDFQFFYDTYVLKPVIIEDAVNIHEYLFSKNNLMTYWGTSQVETYLETLNRVKRWVKRWTNGDLAPLSWWCIYHMENAEFIGCVGFAPSNIELIGGAEIGSIIRKEYWGKGIASNASKTIIQYYDYYHVMTGPLYANIHPNNTRSIKSIKQLGFDFSCLKTIDSQVRYIFKRNQYKDYTFQKKLVAKL